MVFKKATCFAVLSCLFFSCSMFSNFEIPESISIATHAMYSVPLGNARAYLHDHVNAEKLQSIIDTKASGAPDNTSYFGVEVYDYNKDGQDKVQRYLINYPVTEIPLDMSKFFAGLDDLDISNTGSNSFSQEFATQSLEGLDFSQDVAIDFKSIFDDKVNIGNENIPLIPVVEPGTSESEDLVLPMPGEYIDFKFTSPDFTGVTFLEGKLEFNVNVSSGAPSMEMNVKAVLYDGSSRKIAESAAVNIGNGGKLEIDLAGKTIPSVMRFQFAGDFKGGTALNPVAYKVSLSLSPDYKVSKISGLTISSSELEPYAMAIGKDISTAELQQYLKTAVIADGSMTYKLEVPSTWSGVSAAPDLSISGGLEVESAEFVNASGAGSYLVNKQVNLKGKTILPQDLRISGKIGFALNNATVTIDYDGSGNTIDKVNFNARADIKELSNAQLYMNDLLDMAKMNKTLSQTLSGKVIDYIDSITFNQIGLEGEIGTDLPSNDMKLTSTINSTYFDIDSVSDEVLFNKKGPYKIKLTKDYVSEEGSPRAFTITGGPTLDFDIQMQLSGSNEADPGLITFSSICPGKKYNFDFDVNFVYDWVEVVLNTNKANFDGKFNSGFSLDTILEDSMSDQDLIKDSLNKIRFYDDAIEGFFCVTRPDIAALEDFSDASVSSLSMTYNGSTKNLFNGSLSFVPVKASFAELADENLMLTDISSVTTSGVFNGSALVNMLNDKPKDVEFEYAINIGGTGGQLTVTREEVEKMKTAGHTTSIKASIILILALKFYITDDIVIDDAMAVFGSPLENDLLNREDAGEEHSSKEFTDLVKSIRMEYLMKNNCGFKMNVKLSCKDETDTEYLSKEIKISPDTYSWKRNRNTLEFSRSDINLIYEKYPFKPKVSIVIPKTTVEEIPLLVPRSANISIQAAFYAETDGEYNIWGGDD